MQIPSNEGQKKKQGFILIITLAFLVVLLILLGSTMGWIISNSKVTRRNNEYTSSQYAAEGATEKALGQMEYDWLAGTLGNASVYTGLVPTNTSDWPVQYVFSDGSGDTNQMAISIGQQTTNWQALPSPYAGLKAYLTPVTITATATPIHQRFGVPATVSQTFDLTEIPIFQYLIFYNMNLEIAAAQSLTVNGPVFSNAGIWTAQNLTFNSTVWAVQKAVNGGTDPFVSYSGSGSSTYTMRGQPVSGVNHVTMPIAGTNNNPTTVEGILQWPPSSFSLGSAAAFTRSGEVYLANYADLIISNAASGVSMATPTGTNIFAYYVDPSQPAVSNQYNFCSSITWITNDYYIITNVGKGTKSILTNSLPPASQWTNSGNVYRVWYAGYSFLTNATFVDWREGWTAGSGKRVQAVQLDVTNFNKWLANPAGGSNYNAMCNADKNHDIGGVYIYNSIPLSGTVLPAVRIINGSQLFGSYGLSIATPQPLYVQGDFNVTDGSGHSDAGTKSTAHSYPASFLADAITILSSSWKDSTTTKDPNSSSQTTIHAACLEGIVESDQNIKNPSDDSNYSGGVENFLRLLESWGTLYYNGSIVVMFPSEYATNRWRQTGNYYDAPTRNWSFDTNFTVRAKLPPFTPDMKTTVRGTWSGSGT
ncbi:MAG TPA: hypothetical protein VH280_04165 [Verrucomicrobiae bacterium]|jgi:hypothetical protein|nr:hypothetical protein [Verrucomicrobiae bacterium]